jgi:hypothetical protein
MLKRAFVGNEIIRMEIAVGFRQRSAEIPEFRIAQLFRQYTCRLSRKEAWQERNDKDHGRNKSGAGKTHHRALACEDIVCLQNVQRCRSGPLQDP